MPLSGLDRVVEGLLVSMLGFMPLVCGARSAWSEGVVILLSGAIVACFLLKLTLNAGHRFVWSWAYVPLFIFALIAMLQLVPLPAGIVGVLSPNTVAVRAELIGDLPNADTILESGSLSFYADATKHDVRLMLSAIGVFVAVLNVFHRPGQIKRLLLAITLIGGVVATVAIAQNLFGNGKLYWFVSQPHSASSGPFTNHNHFGQFMNLSIGAGFGWICVELHERFAGGRIRLGDVSRYLCSSSARLLWLVLAVMSLGAATVFISLTRGGVLSMLFAGVAILLHLCSRRSLKSGGWIIVIVAIVAFAFVLGIAFDAVCDRLSTLDEFHGYEMRWQTLKDLIECYKMFPILGTGLGTHAVVYPMFKNIDNPLLFTHAENEYAEMLEETGSVGLLVLIVFGVIIWRAYLRSAGKEKSAICSASFGLGFGLLAITIHSWSDYGQHIPANGLLSAVFCALLLSLARQSSRGDANLKELSLQRGSRFLRAVALLGVCGVWGWSMVGVNDARIAEAHWAETLRLEKPLLNRNWEGTEAEYAALIDEASKACAYQPENVKYRHWRNAYRWKSISSGGKAGEPSIVVSSIPEVSDIVSELYKACALCPTYGPPYCLAGQIEMFVLHDSSGASQIRKGYLLARDDPVACLVAARLDLFEGNIEECISKLERAVSNDKRLFKEVVQIYIHELSRPHLAVSAAGDDLARLAHVAGLVYDMQYTDIADHIRKKIKYLLEEKCSTPQISGGAFVALARIYRDEQETEAAIQYYRQALARQYSQVHWRLELAKVLSDSGQLQEAMNETRICLQIMPHFAAAKQLLSDLSVHPGAWGEETVSP